MAALLDISALEVRFPDRSGALRVVHGMDLQIQAGEILGLIGESGSGKSVASQAICRLQEDAIYSGSILLQTAEGSLDLLHANEAVLRSVRRSEIAYIFQEPMTALNPLIRCGKQIEEGLAPGSRGAKDKAIELLARVEIRDPVRAYRAYPHELSGGQRQRVMIAMALAGAPRLLIADEPTTALDIAIQNELLQLLKSLAERDGLSVLFITHDLLSLRGFADRIAVMYRGSIMEVGTADAILSSPSHPYTKALLQSRAGYAKRGRYLAEMEQLLDERDGEYHFTAPLSRDLPQPHPSDEVIIEVSGLRKWHDQGGPFNRKRTEVLHGIDLVLRDGDSLGIVGESGSGKSTIARILLRLWKASAGELRIYGEPLQDFSELENRLQLVFQDPYSSLNPKHRIGSAIEEVLRTVDAEAGPDAVAELLRTVGLDPEDMHRYPHEFSGGQRQRICIAKALAKSPRILVLDEAVSALDVSVQARILNLLNDLKVKKQLSYILISHDMNVVSYFCNRIMVIRSGEVVEIGHTEQLVKNAQSTYTRSLLQHSIY